MQPDDLRRGKKSITQDYIFDLLLLILSSLHIIYGLVSISMWVMLAALLLMTVLRQNFKMSVDGCIKYWWAFAIWSIVGIVYTNDTTYAIGYVLKIIVLVFTLSYYSNEDNSDRTFGILKIIILIWISTIILELFFPSQIRVIRTAISTSSEGNLETIERAISLLGTKYGVFSDPAVGAFFCACGIGLGIGFLIEKKKLLGWAWIVFSAIGIVLTNKRGPMLSVALASGLVYLIRSSTTVKKKIERVIIVFVVIAVVIFLFTHNQTLVNWFARVNQNQYSNRNRQNLYITLYNNFLKHPILGSGTKSTRVLLNGTDGHNIYLAALSENGILGLVLLLVGFVSGLKNTISIMRDFDSLRDRKLNGVITFCLFTQIYIICYGMTGNPMTTIYSLAMYFMCLGIPLREHRLLRAGYFDAPSYVDGDVERE